MNNSVAGSCGTEKTPRPFFNVAWLAVVKYGENASSTWLNDIPYYVCLKSVNHDHINQFVRPSTAQQPRHQDHKPKLEDGSRPYVVAHAEHELSLTTSITISLTAKSTILTEVLRQVIHHRQHV